MSEVDLAELFAPYVRERGQGTFSEFRVLHGFGDRPLSNRTGRAVRRVVEREGFIPFGDAPAEAPISNGRICRIWADPEFLRRKIAPKPPAPAESQAPEKPQRRQRRGKGAA